MMITGLVRVIIVNVMICAIHDRFVYMSIFTLKTFSLKDLLINDMYVMSQCYEY